MKHTSANQVVDAMEDSVGQRRTLMESQGIHVPDQGTRVAVHILIPSWHLETYEHIITERVAAVIKEDHPSVVLTHTV